MIVTSTLVRIIMNCLRSKVVPFFLLCGLMVEKMCCGRFGCFGCNTSSGHWGKNFHTAVLAVLFSSSRNPSVALWLSADFLFLVVSPQPCWKPGASLLTSLGPWDPACRSSFTGPSAAEPVSAVSP